MPNDLEQLANQVLRMQGDLERLANQVPRMRAQLAALTALLKETPAGDGESIMSAARHKRLEELFEYELKLLTSDPGRLHLG